MGITFPQWPVKEMEGYNGEIFAPPADVEQIELETPSVRGSATSWGVMLWHGIGSPSKEITWQSLY